MNLFEGQAPFEFEPLEKAARMSWERAPHLCSDACRSYHQTWSINRFLGTNGLGPWGIAFFKQGFASVEAKFPSVLISGSADTGVLALVIAAMGERAKDSHFTIVDICKTPLAQVSMMIEELQLNGTVIHDNILNLDTDPFDAIVAHSFIGFFPPDIRADLFQTWFDHLKPGGRLLVANSTAQQSGAQRPEPKEKHLSEALSKLSEKAQAWGMTPEECDLLAELNIQREMKKSRYQHWTAQEYEAELAKVGFVLELVSLDENQLSQAPQASLRSSKEQKVILKTRARTVMQFRRPL